MSWRANANELARECEWAGARMRMGWRTMAIGWGTNGKWLAGGLAIELTWRAMSDKLENGFLLSFAAALDDDDDDDDDGGGKEDDSMTEVSIDAECKWWPRPPPEEAEIPLPPPPA